MSVRLQSFLTVQHSADDWNGQKPESFEGWTFCVETKRHRSAEALDWCCDRPKREGNGHQRRPGNVLFRRSPPFPRLSPSLPFHNDHPHTSTAYQNSQVASLQPANTCHQILNDAFQELCSRRHCHAWLVQDRRSLCRRSILEP